MTVSSELNKHVYAGNDATTSFPVTFYVLDEDDLHLYLTNTTLGTTTEITTNFTVFPTGGSFPASSGTITYPTIGDPLATGYKLTIIREMDVLQETIYPNNTALKPKVVETSLDRSAMISQQLNESMGRALIADVSATTNYTLPAALANAAIGWDSAGTALENKTTANVFSVTDVQASLTMTQSLADYTGTVKALDIITKGPCVDVRAFGAVGDGVTDDVVKIQAAIDFASTNKHTLRIPGTINYYLISTTLNIPNNLTIEQENTGTARIHYTGVSVAVSLNGDRIRWDNFYITGTGLNNPTTDNGQTGLLMNEADFCTFINPRIYNVGKGISFGDTGQYNHFYSPEIRYCYRGVTTEQATTYVGEQSFHGGRISACYNNVYLDSHSGCIRFFGTCIEGNTHVDGYLVDIQGGSYNAFFGCRFERSDTNYKTIRVGSGATLTAFYGNYDCAVEDYGSSTIIDHQNGQIEIARKQDLAITADDNLIANGDLRGGLRGFGVSNLSYTYNAGNGYSPDSITMTPSAVAGYGYVQYTLTPSTKDREFTAWIRYKRDGGGSQKVRLRAGGNATATIANAYDDQSTSDTVLYFTTTLPANEVYIRVYIYPNTVGTATITLYKIGLVWGKHPICKPARIENSATPTQGTWILGEVVYNSSPSELGAGGSKYIILGWMCTVAGTPGTWLPMRVLTGN